MSAAKPDRCVRCGAAFECGATAGKETCWCMELPPVMTVTDEGCLCRKCLEAAIAERSGSKS